MLAPCWQLHCQGLPEPAINDQCRQLLPSRLETAGTTAADTPTAAAALLQAGGMPGRVHFLWVARHPKEFCIMDADIMAAAT